MTVSYNFVSNIILRRGVIKNIALNYDKHTIKRNKIAFFKNQTLKNFRKKIYIMCKALLSF